MDNMSDELKSALTTIDTLAQIFSNQSKKGTWVKINLLNKKPNPRLPIKISISDSIIFYSSLAIVIEYTNCCAAPECFQPAQ